MYTQQKNAPHERMRKTERNMMGAIVICAVDQIWMIRIKGENMHSQYNMAKMLNIIKITDKLY